MTASQPPVGVHVPRASPDLVGSGPGCASEHAAVAAFGRFALESHDLDATIDRCTELTTQLLGVQVGAVLRLTGQARVQVMHVRGPSGLAPGQEFPIPPEVLAATFQMEGPLSVVDWQAEDGIPEPPLVRTAGMRSVLSVGVLAGGRLWGRLVAMNPGPHQFSGAQVDFLQSVAHLLAAAVERDRTEQAQAASTGFGRFALESRDIAATVRRAVDVATRVLDAPMGSVTRLLPSPDRAVAEYSQGPFALRAGAEFDVLPWLAAQHRSTEPLIIRDWHHETRFAIPPAVTASGIRSSLAVSVLIEGRPWGRLGVMDTRPRRFTASDVDLISSMAHMLAAALQRNRIEVRLREHAHDLQRALLPATLATVAGIEVAARYVPAGGGDVGGDWYDVLPLPQGGVGLVIGDVEGHDSAAAAEMGQVRNALRAFAGEGHSPAEIMNRVNRFVTAHLDRTVTCCYAELRPAERSLTYVVAGHPPPLLVTRAGSIRPVPHTAGLLLGYSAEYDYVERTTLLPPGGHLLLVTDGLMDDSPAAIHRGPAELAAAVRGRLDEPVEALANHVIAMPAGAPAPRDDAALLVIRLPHQAVRHSAGQQVARVFAASPECAAAARRFVGDIAAGWGLSALEDAATLAVSELVTNALLHTTSSIHLTMRTTADQRLWIGVRDDSDRRPHLRNPGPDEIAGRGLAIVAALAHRWGVDVDPHGSGKIVWVELLADRPA